MAGKAARQRRFNNFIIKDNNQFFDSTSKFFITFEAILGLNRLPLIYEIKFYKRCLMFLYVSVCFIIVLTVPMIFYSSSEATLKMAATVIEYSVCSICSYVFIDRLRMYYEELRHFDEEVRIQIQISKQNVQLKLFGYLILLTLTYLSFFFSVNSEAIFFLFLHVLPLRVVHVLELYFYGYLLSFIQPRVRFLYDLVEASLTRSSSPSEKDIEKNIGPDCEQSNKCIFLYNIIIKAHHKLVNAIKWQMMVIITMSFLGTLCISYQISLSIISGDLDGSIWVVVSYVCLCLCNAMPLFGPCLMEDQLKGEVRRIRRLIASRLHDQDICKSSRATARDLLSMTRVRDFSFSLLGMFEVDVTLPFKFVSLVVSYVVIILQFEKMMVIITMSFLGTLCISYQISLSIISGDLDGSIWVVVSYVCLCLCNAMPLFGPCLMEDQLKGEVRRIRRLIASRLHDQDICKSSRATARDLLSMTRVRDFSFSLLGMFEVDVTLPFKFVSLVVSYVVIILQFEKMMVIITMSFLGTLCISYQISLSIISGDLDGSIWVVVSYVCLCLCNAMPLFGPCLMEDQLKGEVRRIRRLIASRLHDQDICKSSRATARDLLSMTRVRDFSFSLLGMFEVDVTLPFKFVSLVVSYVVIILQFEKVFQS